MKNRILNVLLITLVFTMLLASCSFSDDALMTLRFSIVNERARTISSETTDIEIAKYTFTLSPKNRTTEAVTETFDKKASGTYDMKNITPGSYSLKVEGKTQDGSVISEASQDIFLERENKSGSKIIEVELTALSGRQSVNIVYTWDVKSYSNNMTVKLNIKKQGAAAGEDVELEIDQAAGTATYTGDLNAGSYIFKATLQKGSTVYVGHIEVIRVTNSSSTLSETIAIDQKAVMALSTNVTEKIASPIEGTVTVTKNTNADNFTLSLKITKKPNGVADKDITVAWYNEDILIDTVSAVASMSQVSLLSGCTRVTAVMWCPDIPGSMGAASDFGVN